MFASLAKFAFDAAQETAENADAGNTTTTSQEPSTIFTEDNLKYAAIGLGAAAVVGGVAYWYTNRDKAEATKGDAAAKDGKKDETKDEAKPATEAKPAQEAAPKTDDPAARAKQAAEDLEKAIANAQDLLKKGQSNDGSATNAA
jgi:hypothetical protein